MNVEGAIAELDKFIRMTVLRKGSGDSFITTSDYTAAPDAEVAQQAQIVEKVISRVIPDWRTEFTGKMANNRWARHREAAIRVREELVRAEEVRQNLGENAPDLSAADMHPWIWSRAKSLWQSRHFREAVEGAIKKLNAETQNKVVRRDVSESDLFKQAFTLDEPKAGKLRLRRMPDDGSDTYKSVQRGAVALAEDVFAGIRNPLSHEAERELSEQEALEYLAALSVFARWVDASEVEAAS